jgi:putative transposase
VRRPCRGPPLREGPIGLEGEPLHEGHDLSHVRWDCKDRIVIIPKYRCKVFSGKPRRQIGVILWELCRQRGCLSIPPKFSVAHTVGFLKGQSAVQIHRELLHERRLTELPFWAAGYCITTVGLDEARVRQSLREQEELERRPGEFDFESPLTCPGKAPPLPRAKAPSRAPRGPHAWPDRQPSCQAEPVTVPIPLPGRGRSLPTGRT